MSGGRTSQRGSNNDSILRTPQLNVPSLTIAQPSATARMVQPAPLLTLSAANALDRGSSQVQPAPPSNVISTNPASSSSSQRGRSSNQQSVRGRGTRQRASNTDSNLRTPQVTVPTMIIVHPSNTPTLVQPAPSVISSASNGLDRSTTGEVLNERTNAGDEGIGESVSTGQSTTQQQNHYDASNVNQLQSPRASTPSTSVGYNEMSTPQSNQNEGMVRLPQAPTTLSTARPRLGLPPSVPSGLFHNNNINNSSQQRQGTYTPQLTFNNVNNNMGSFVQSSSEARTHEAVQGPQAQLSYTSTHFPPPPTYNDEADPHLNISNNITNNDTGASKTNVSRRNQSSTKRRRSQDEYEEEDEYDSSDDKFDEDDEENGTVYNNEASDADDSNADRSSRTHPRQRKTATTEPNKSARAATAKKTPPPKTRPARGKQQNTKAKPKKAVQGKRKK